MRPPLLLPVVAGLFGVLSGGARADALPFRHKVEVYHTAHGGPAVFVLRLEQPFLAEEFEQSSYLRLLPRDQNAFLVYPRQTRFRQKHAEFYGRLRGQGKAKLRLSYETVTETQSGARKVTVRHADVEIPIPTKPGGPENLYRAWAEQQNDHFLRLLKYHPDETFFQYVLLQSEQRYGVEPPRWDRPEPDPADIEAGLYGALTGSLALQEALQLQVLRGKTRTQDLTLHVSQLSPPELRALPYAQFLEQKAAKKILPHVPDISRLIPEDQYFLHFNSIRPAHELLDLTEDWGTSLLRLFTVRAQDHRLVQKFDEQLILRRDPLTRLFADGVVAELAVTGSDPFVLEGTDVTIVFRLKQPEVFDKAAAGWLAETKGRHPDLVEREFNYRGHKVAARYTEDRVVSSFVVRHGPFVVFSNSHRAVRNLIDAATGKGRRLFDAADFRYVTTLLPPGAAADMGYFFASEAFLRRLVGPQAKISEKRRLQCFNNLVMFNNASLFYRLEHAKGPASLTDLTEGRYVDAGKVVCSHGGAYTWDARRDTCTCSLHNRIKYLTPNAELNVLKIARAEAAEYERYKRRYAQFWQGAFDPIAIRVTVARRVKLETCVLPFANGSLYRQLRAWVDDRPRPIDLRRVAPSAVVSLAAVPGRKAAGQALRLIPGVEEALRADPTLTDLGWLGDRASLHFCDGETILEIDPARLRSLDIPLGIPAPVTAQVLAAAALTATEVPTYATLEVEDRDKAARLLRLLARQAPLQKGKFLNVSTALDAYRLPDYKKHERYVFTFRVYAVKARLHVALVGNRLVAATKEHVLHEVIDAAAAAPDKDAPAAHVLMRFNVRALGRLHDNFSLSWAEKSRRACHHNAISIYNLVKLYDVPVKEVDRLSEAKYGVRYFCPEHGVYEYDAGRDQVVCSVHGNRQDARQDVRLGRRSSFARFLAGLDEVVARLRFQDEALFATVEIARRAKAEE